ncbi:MAG TPA: choice-of-anchor tandem repeat GloVer-containing protein, partial [Verrucomicrobiae bacterium]|nr:choice-of-anchor tandem repeat GloVer-containing protein [Verrucomicrobiae bacterium]
MIKTLKSLKLCILAIGLSVPIASHAGVTLTNIFSFNGTNGALPRTLVRAANNKFYGITENGGPNFTGPENEDVGGVYSITSDGVFSNLYFFEGTNGSGGVYLTPGSDGNFYGTTEDTVFKLNPDGTMANPHLATLPNYSQALGLVQDHDGTLYG